MAGFSVSEAETLFHDNVSAMKKEYTRLRDIAQKRISRLGKSEFSESKAYLAHASGFAKLKDLDPRDLPKAFSELSKFVGAKASTVTGQKQIRAKTISTWKQQGLSLNQQNYPTVIKILEEMRKQKLVYGSDKAVELADSMLYLDDQKTADWMSHLGTLLEHSSEIKEMTQSGYTPVDMDSFIKEVGW